MKILVTSDIHGNISIANKLKDIYSHCDAELLLICGDIGGKNFSSRTLNDFGKKQEEQYNDVMNILRQVQKPIKLILGNDDWFDVDDSNIMNLGDEYKDIVAFNLVAITPFDTNREANENKIEFELNNLRSTKQSIILAHNPPEGVCDLTWSGLNVGSKAVKRFIKNKQPKLWLCGHIHESYGDGYIDNTLVLNCACDHTKNLLRGYLVDTDIMEFVKV